MRRVTRNGKAMLLADEEFNRLDIEAWIIRHLGEPNNIREGSTTYEIRRQRIRARILERELANVPASAKTKETWGSVYERFYGESLSAKTKGNLNVIPA